MNAKETERIIAFHGLRRGAAHIRSGAEGTRIALTLRPGARAGAPVPVAACIAGLDGRAVRIALSNGAGRTEVCIDPAVLLLVADAPEGEIFCAEGARGMLDRSAIEALKRPLRALRKEGGGQRSGTQAEKTESPERMKQAAAACEMPEQVQPRVEESACTKQKPVVRQEAPIPPQPRSEALQSILSKANELFPPGGGEGGAAAHFASDAPLHGAFMPRPLAAQAGQGQKNRQGVVRAGAVAAQTGAIPGQKRERDAQWTDAVRELSCPERAPKPSGVGAAEQAEGLFPEAFPGFSWQRVRYPGTRRYYLVGTGHADGARCTVYALPGNKFPPQPYRARGFTRFVQDVNGNGYWVKVKRER